MMRKVSILTLGLFLGLLAAISPNWLSASDRSDRVTAGEQIATTTNRQSSPCKTVEVKGLCFQSFISEREVEERAQSIQAIETLPIPQSPPKDLKFADYQNSIPFYPTIRVTNTTEKPIYFARYGLISASFIDSNGESVEELGLAFNPGRFNPAATGSALVLPGESVNLSMRAGLFWYRDTLLIRAGGKHTGEYATFYDLKPGIYQLQLTYENQLDEVENKLNPDQFSIPEGAKTQPQKQSNSPANSSTEQKQKVIWKGEATLPLIEFRLVQ